MLLLLSCWIIAAITAADPPVKYYQMINDSICLRVGKSPPHTHVEWLLSEDAIVLAGKITPNYLNKVNYNPNDSSLCINGLAEMDGGDYTFSFFNSEFKKSSEIHTLIVQGTVPTPVISVSALHSNLSADFCMIAINCSVRDDWALSVCDQGGCTTSQRSLAMVNITVFVDNTSIFCRGNNHVSASIVSLSTESTCRYFALAPSVAVKPENNHMIVVAEMCFCVFPGFNKSNPEHEETPEPSVIVVIVVVIAACLSLGALTVFMVMRLVSGKFHHHHAESSTAAVIQSQPLEADPQSAPRGSSSHINACYENVDVPQPSGASRPTASPQEQSGSGQEVETVYSVLQLPNVTCRPGESDRSKDATEQEEMREAPSSPCVTMDEAERHVDTLYSVLQKPPKISEVPASPRGEAKIFRGQRDGCD